MKRILFVDDEANILDGLRRMLRPLRKDWEMVFASSGEEALRASEEAPFDVVVTDLRMPGMDGAQLLASFHARHPQTVRLVLSGHSELEGVMRAVPLAHQYLTKPCDAATLKDTVTRALELQNLLDDDCMRQLIGQMGALPSRPETYADIVRALADPEVEIAAVVKIVASDVAMSAKLLQLANSAFFGLAKKIADVGEATTYLGLNTIRDLTLSLEVFRPPADGDDGLKTFLTELQARSIWTGGVARRMFDDRARASQAFAAGLLHDIGLLVMAAQLPEQLAEVVQAARASQRPLHVVERDLHGVSHAEIGAYLLGVWGLPYAVLEAAAYHHRPADLPQAGFSELTAVHVASSLVSARFASSSALSHSQIDLSYLEALGVRDRLEEWEALVETDAAASKCEARR